MPQATKQRRSSRTVRESINARGIKARPRCQGGSRTTAQAPRIIANSLFALTLKPIPGVAFDLKKPLSKNRFHSEDDYEQMYHDLLKCVQHALKLQGVETKADPYAAGIDLSASLVFVTSLFEHEILPGKLHGEYQWLYNIDKDDHGYYFTIYKYCEMQQYWHAFEIKHVVKYLYTRNKPVHDIFIRFLKTFMAYTDIKAWYNGALGYADYWFDEEIEFWWDNHDKTDKDDISAYKEALKTRAVYATGEAKRYQLLLEKTTAENPAKLIDELLKFSKKNKLVNWMIEACAFMQKRHAYINGFIYEEDDAQEGLKFDQQVGIIWDWDDEYTHAQSEAMDSDANSVGICSPCFFYHITPHTERFDKQELHEAIKIPLQIDKLFDHYYDAVNPLNKDAKRKN